MSVARFGLALPLLSLTLATAAPSPVLAQTTEAAPGDAGPLVARWKASNATCRNQAASAIDAVGACEQRDTFSKLLGQANYCQGPDDGATAPAGWALCGANPAGGQPGAKAQDTAHARSTAQFQRMGGVFVLPATINGSTKAYFIVDSGAANVQIPQEVADEMKASGRLTEADALGQRRFTLADGRGVQQRVVRLKTVQIGNRAMDNVLAAIGPPSSRPLLGQSFLRRLNWWKIDNVRNAIEFEFTGAF